MQKVLCIGEALIDAINQDEKILERNVGGAPLNVACAIAKLNGNAAYYGAIGDDEDGKKILDTLKKFDVQSDVVQVLTDCKTTVANVFLGPDGTREFTFNLDADQKMNFDFIKNEFEKFDIFHFGSATALLNPEPEAAYLQMLELAKKLNKTVIFDPNWRPLLWNHDEETFRKKIEPFLAGADFVKLSDEELAVATNMKDLMPGFNAISHKYPGATFFVTLGKEGCLVGRDGQWNKSSVAQTGNPVDTTGAGDAFIGSIIKDLSIYGQSWEEHLPEMLDNANRFAQKSIYFKGALTYLDNLS